MASRKEHEPAEDALLSVIGQNGKWQFTMFIVVSIIGIPSAWNMLAITFLAPNDLDHWCAPAPGFEKWTAEQWKRYAIPTEQKDGREVYQKCHMYDLDYSLVPRDPDNVAAVPNNTAVIGCRTWTADDNSSQTYAYNLTRFKDTIINNYDLVCSSDQMVAHAQSTYMVGNMFGVTLGGMFADWFGRRLTFLLFTVSLLVSGVATAFTQSAETFMAFRSLLAFSCISLFTISFVYIMELVGGRWRTIYGIMFQFSYAIGIMSVAVIAYFANAWRTLQLCITVPVVTFFIFFWIIPESPRWLSSRGRQLECGKILEKICAKNGISYQCSVPLNNESSAQITDDAPRGSIFDLFRTPNLRKRTLNFYCSWFVISFVYFGLSLNSGDLGGNVFVNMFISGGVELPAYALSIFLLMKSGRRWPLCLSMVIGGVACLGTMLFEKNVYTLDWPILTFAMIGKFCSSASFAMVYVFSAEMFPTVTRTIGVGSSSMCARIASIIAPYVSFYGQRVSRHLPMICFGVTSIIAGLFVLLLPETKGKSLPNTIEEGELFGTKKALDPNSKTDHSINHDIIDRSVNSTRI